MSDGDLKIKLEALIAAREGFEGIAVDCYCSWLTLQEDAPAEDDPGYPIWKEMEELAAKMVRLNEQLAATIDGLLKDGESAAIDKGLEMIHQSVRDINDRWKR